MNYTVTTNHNTDIAGNIQECTGAITCSKL